MKLQSIRVAVLSIFLLASAAVFVSAVEKPGQPQLTKREVKALIVNAQTLEDHMKLAAYFRDEAQQEESKAKYHDEMAELYTNNPMPKIEMAKHCKHFAEEARLAAESDNQLASEHEKMAEQARQGK
jgi:hypothetical protein